MKTLSRHLTAEDHARLVEGGLGAAEAAALRDHLGACPACSREAASYAGAVTILRERPTAVPPRDFEARLRTRLAEVRLAQPSAQLRATRVRRLAWGLSAGALAAIAIVGFHLAMLHTRAAHLVTVPHAVSAPSVAVPPVASLTKPRQASNGRVAAVAPSPVRPARTEVTVPAHGRRATVIAPEPRRAAKPRPVAPAATSDTTVARGTASALARIVSVRGMPVVAAGTKKQRLASLDSQLGMGESLRGGETDRALVRWPDAAQVATYYSTTVEVPEPGTTGEARLRLKRGKVWVWAPGDGQGVEIETPAGMALVRRGEAMITTGGPELVTLIAALSGDTDLVTRTKKLNLQPGEAATLRDGDLVGAPQMLSAPKLLRRGVLWGSEYHIWRSQSLRREELLAALAAPRVEMGVVVQPLPASGGGLVVHRVAEGSPAAQAGLEPGDVLVALDGQQLESGADLLVRQLQPTPPLQVAASVRRGREALTLALDCTQQPPVLPWPPSVRTLLQAAVASLATGDLATAKARLREAASKDGTCAAVYYNLGLAFEHEARWPETVAAYHQAAELATQSVMTHLAYGRALLGIANLDGAARELRRALGLDGGLLDARSLLGRALLFGGDPEAAASEAKALLACPGGLVSGARLLGDIAAVRGERREAATHYRQALQADPYDLEAKTQLAIELDAAGEDAEAERQARELFTWDPTSFRAASLVGTIRLRARDTQTAEDWLTRAQALCPGISDGYSNLGALYSFKRDTVRSEAYYREALQISGEMPATHIGLAMVLETTDRLVEAEQEYLQALALDPASTQALERLAALYRSGEQQEKVAALLSRYGPLGT